jgi:hypothetical protein
MANEQLVQSQSLVDQLNAQVVSSKQAEDQVNIALQSERLVNFALSLSLIHYSIQFMLFIQIGA